MNDQTSGHMVLMWIYSNAIDRQLKIHTVDMSK